ncbi:mucin-2-like [Paramacrobiotus metropolitanus]|uniref:mucin-2-like n=1 Tax=Paramacrobiotus metropolitanus TaxID=2943436 RepID=UPI0024457230|nr:mucin-2-like [Paramacrobiotus metropolitanus]
MTTGGVFWLLLAAAWMTTVKVFGQRYDEYYVQPGKYLPPYAAYNDRPPPPRTPYKVPQYDPDTPSYEDSPAADYGPNYWRGQHIRPTPTANTCPATTPPPCSTLLTTVTGTVVGALCAQTTITLYAGGTVDSPGRRRRSNAETVTVTRQVTVTVTAQATSEVVVSTTVYTDRTTIPCTAVEIRLPTTDATSPTVVPCCPLTLSETKTRTCTLNVQVTSYRDVENRGGTLYSALGQSYPPVTVSSRCTVRNWQG